MSNKIVFTDANEQGVIIESEFNGKTAKIGMPRGAVIYLGANGKDLIKGEPVHTFEHLEIHHGQPHPIAMMFGQFETIVADKAVAYTIDTSALEGYNAEEEGESLLLVLAEVGDYTFVCYSGLDVIEKLEAGESFLAASSVLTAGLPEYSDALAQIYA